MILQVWAFLNTIVVLPLAVSQLITGALIYIIGKSLKNEQLKVHGKQLAIAVDQFVNVVWLGDPDETISSRCGRAIISGRPKWYIKYLLWPFIDKAAMFFGDAPNHSLRAIEYDEVKKDDYEVWSWYKKD